MKSNQSLSTEVKVVDFNQNCGGSPLEKKKHLPKDYIKFKATGIKENHQRAINSIREKKTTMIHGCAGTGKTFIILNTGLQMLAEREYRNITIVRNTVDVRNSGFLPGTEDEKNAPFEEAYKLIVRETFDVDNDLDYYVLRDKMKVLNFRSTRFNQGITLRDSFILVDEAQNLTYNELFNIFTRQGDGCTIHFSGDYVKQDFLPRNENSGYRKFIEVLKSSEDLSTEFNTIEMTPDDILRSDRVKRFILADYHFDHKSFDEKEKKKGF